MKNNLLKIGIVVSPFLFLLTGVVGKVQAEPYGWSPNVDNSWQGPPKCTDAKPDKAPILLQPNHPVLPKKAKAGEIVLYWHKVPGASGYNIYYGLSPKNYIFSAPDIGDTNNFTVRFLANKKYYIAVQAKKGCAAGSLSAEWAARPGMGGYIAGNVQGIGIKAVKRTTTPTYDQTPSYKTTIISTPVPTSAAAVKGTQTGRTGSDTPQQYNPSPAPPVRVTVTPKPKNWWETIISFIFGR